MKKAFQLYKEALVELLSDALSFETSRFGVRHGMWLAGHSEYAVTVNLAAETNKLHLGAPFHRAILEQQRTTYARQHAAGHAA